MPETTYRIVDAHVQDGFISLLLRVGTREKLNSIALTRPEAWRLFRHLSAALEATD